MEIKAYTETLEPLGVLDEVKSVIWHPKYWDVGFMKILAPLTENNRKILKNGVILVKHYDEETAEQWRRAAQINYIHISTSETGAEEIEAQGLFLSSWAKNRLIVKPIVTKATNADIIKRIIRENLGGEAGPARQLPAFEMLQTGELGGTAVEYSHNILVDAAQEIHDRAVAGKLGYDILVNERSKKYGFKIYKGKDLTQGNKNGNKPCIFSKEFDNVNEQEYTSSTENVKNVTYICGQAEKDGTVPVVAEVGNAAGLDRKEVYTDAADIQRTYKEGQTEIMIPLSTYVKMLEDAGLTNLESYAESTSFSSEIKAGANLKYRTDYDIGDRVTSVEKRWGLRIDVRITEVEEVTEKGKDSVNVTFGESLPELLEKIRKVR